MGGPDYLRAPTREEYLEARQVALRLREVATHGSKAGAVLHHLSNAMGADPADEWAVIVMRAMVEQARGILGD
jgi:hypothetical protein